MMESPDTFGPADSLELTQLIQRYRNRGVSPRSVITQILDRIEKYDDPAVWISRFSKEDLFDQIDAAEKRLASGIAQPLLGIPFAVKDNIDVDGLPTTAACPAFRYQPDRSATVVQKLCDAGAIVIGKTNLDQFATGLVGTRSPYGACKNTINGQYISGGSSSGSAVAVAANLVTFALGTDTAGSGRVPAAFNNLVGLKASCGRLSNSGVVPACRSLDCVSIFTHTCDEAKLLLDIAQGYDPTDAYSKKFGSSPAEFGNSFKFGVLAEQEQIFFGDDEAKKLYQSSIRSLQKLGGRPVEIDFSPFLQVAQLLYFGPWVAERSMVAEQLLKTQPDALLPVTRKILEAGLKLTGIQVFEGQHRLESLRLKTSAQWEKMNVLLLPTTGTIYTIQQVEADPIDTNTTLGRYTNFVNLLDLCAVAIPAGFRSNGLPAGVTVIAPSGADEPLLDLADRLHQVILLERN